MNFFERFRGELFAGTMRYVGGVQFDDGTSEPLSSQTGYLGLGGEYDLMIEPEGCPNLSFLAGIGSRFWFRDLKDGMTDFGLPVTAFLICRFWLVDAWWSIGRHDDARNLFVDALKHRNRYGLLSEDIDPKTGKMWGNFPQTYSMAGLILTAMRLSRSWEDRYWR